MSVVLITGGTSTLANALALQMRSLGHEVVLGVRGQPNEETTVQLDISNEAQVDFVISKIQPELIINLAANFSTNFDESFSTNVGGAKNLLNAVRKLKGKPRLVLIGSAAEYGAVAPTDNPVCENQLLSPVSIYGLTKSWQSSLGQLHAVHGMDVVIARMFNLDGPGLSPRLFVGNVDRQILEIRSGIREKIKVGPLSATRDYIKVSEAATQICAISMHGCRGMIYHVASGKPVTMRGFLEARLIENKLKIDIVEESLSSSTHLGFDVPMIYADISRTSALLRIRT